MTLAPIAMDSFVPTDPGDRWPSGKYEEVAVIALSEAALSQLLQMTPLHGTEVGLGPWVAFGGALEGKTIELIRYEQSPRLKGFTLRVDSGADLGAVFDRFIELAGISPGELLWVSESLVDRGDIDSSE